MSAHRSRTSRMAFSKLSAMHAVFGLECPYTGHERLVAAVLILDFDPDVGGAYRGLDGIAKRAGISRRQAARAVKSLVERVDEAGRPLPEGPLVVKSKPQARRDGAGGRAPNLYGLTLNAPPASNQGDECPPGIQPEGGLNAKTGGVECQNRGGLSAHQAQDLIRDRIRDRSSSCASHGDTPPPALVLESPEPNARTVRAKASKSKSEQTTEHKLVVEHYFRVFEANRGAKPTFDGADGTAIKNLLKKCGNDAERACRAITDGFASWRGDTLSIRAIASDPSKFIGAKPRNGASAMRVQNAGIDPLGESL